MKRVGDCPLCQCEIWLPDELFLDGMKSKATFFCSYGHKQQFSENTIKYYWWHQSKTVTKNQNHNNVIQLFKEKGHEAQPNP